MNNWDPDATQTFALQFLVKVDENDAMTMDISGMIRVFVICACVFIVSFN